MPDTVTSTGRDLLSIGSRRPCFFMHIPKTAGESMRLYLRSQYHADEICPATTWDDLARDGTDPTAYKLIVGHYQFNVRDLLPEDTRTLVILRDPIRRTISALRHLQRDPKFHDDHMIARELSLPQILRTPSLMEKQRNVQARALTASTPARRVLAYVTQALAHGSSPDPHTLEEPPDLELAKQRLHMFDFVGATEGLPALVESLNKRMRFHPWSGLPLINHAPPDLDPADELSVDDIAILHAHNDVDLPLYEYANRKFFSRSFRKQCRRLVRSGIYHIPSRSFEIDLADVIPGSGWYESECEGGPAWRWTGPSARFTLDLLLRTDAPYRFSMSFATAAPLRPGDFAVSLNGVTQLVGLAADGDGYRCEFPIEQRTLRDADGLCRLEFHVGQPRRASDADSRMVGCCVWRIALDFLNDGGAILAPPPWAPRSTESSAQPGVLPAMP